MIPLPPRSTRTDTTLSLHDALPICPARRRSRSERDRRRRMNRSASEKREGHAEKPLPFDLNAIRTQFPILKETVRGKRLAYLDNAETTQKPETKLQALDHSYRTARKRVV